MKIGWNTIRIVAILSLLLLVGSVATTSVSAQDPTATSVAETITQPIADQVDDKDNGFDDWGLLGLLGLVGLAGLLRKPKTEVQPVTRTVIEPPIDRTRP